MVSALVFIPFLGNCNLFDWDEVNFAECAREMLMSGDYSTVQIAFRPFWEKPPLFIWMQALSMHLFGVGEFAARFPNAVCGMLTVFLLYRIGSRLQSRRFGLMWALLLASTLLPHLYFKSGIIDPWYNFFILLSLYCAYSFIQEGPSYVKALFAGLVLGLAVLTKGPVALLLVALTLLVYLFWTKQVKKLLSLHMLVFVLITLLVSGSWFLVEGLRGNANLIREFIQYQLRLLNTGDSGHGGPWYYHLVVLLIGCFPVSLVFLLDFNRSSGDLPNSPPFRKLMLALFWVVLLVFSVVKTKIIHYSSLCYFPMTYLAARVIEEKSGKVRFSAWSGVLYTLLALILSSAFVLITMIEHWKENLIGRGWIKDEFAVQCLRSDVSWGSYEFLIGVFFLLASFMVFRGIQSGKRTQVYTGATIHLVVIFFAILLIIPRIEAYTQRSAIDFYKSLSKEHCYLETRGFKSYAYLFYSERKSTDYTNPDQIRYTEAQLQDMEKNGYSRLTSYALANLLWLENGKIDRPAYVIAKTIDEDVVSLNKNLSKLYNKNGYSFFIRKP